MNTRQTIKLLRSTIKDLRARNKQILQDKESQSLQHQKDLKNKDRLHRKENAILFTQVTRKLNEIKSKEKNLDRLTQEKIKANNEAQKILASLQSIYSQYNTDYHAQRMQLAMVKDQEKTVSGLYSDLNKNMNQVIQ